RSTARLVGPRDRRVDETRLDINDRFEDHRVGLAVLRGPFQDRAVERVDADAGLLCGEPGFERMGVARSGRYRGAAVAVRGGRSAAIRTAAAAAACDDAKNRRARKRPPYRNPRAHASRVAAGAKARLLAGVCGAGVIGLLAELCDVLRRRVLELASAGERAGTRAVAGGGRANSAVGLVLANDAAVVDAVDAERALRFADARVSIRA